MESVLVWLAVMAATFHMAVSQSNCTNGGVQVIGVTTEEVAAGRVEVCVNQEWRAVCDEGWNQQTAMFACRQIFQKTGYAAVWCTNSCFGSSSKLGVDIQNCTVFRNLSCVQPLDSPCGSNQAGVVCCRDNSTCPIPQPAPTKCPQPPPVTLPSECEACTCPTSPMTPETPTMGPASTDANRESCPSLSGLGGGLGALTAILVILLVVAIIGGVWIYCRKSSQKTHPYIDDVYDNPTYSPHFFTNNNISRTPSIAASFRPADDYEPKPMGDPYTANSEIEEQPNSTTQRDGESLPLYAPGHSNTLPRPATATRPRVYTEVHKKEGQQTTLPTYSEVKKEKKAPHQQGEDQLLHTPGHGSTLPRPASAIRPRVYTEVHKKEGQQTTLPIYSEVKKPKKTPQGEVDPEVNKNKPPHPSETNTKEDKPGTIPVYSEVNKKKGSPEMEVQDQPTTVPVYAGVNKKKKVGVRPAPPPPYAGKQASPQTEETKRVYHVLEGPGGEEGSQEGDSGMVGEQGGVEETP